MPSFLRPFAAWIAIACLALGSLLPLSSLAAKTPAAAMAICSTGTAWQTPGSGPAQSASHAHCLYCGSSQPFTFDFPQSNASTFRAALIYFTASAPQRMSHPHLLREDSWARAPPPV